MPTKCFCRLTSGLGLAGIALVLGLSFEARAAIPGACYGPGNEPEVIYAWITNWYGPAFPLDEKTCDKITNKAVAACHKAVAEAAKCHEKLLDTLRNLAKPGCEGDQDCLDYYRGNVDQQRGFLEDETDSADATCDGDFAENLFDFCTTGIQ